MRGSPGLGFDQVLWNSSQCHSKYATVLRYGFLLRINFPLWINFPTGKNFFLSVFSLLWNFYFFFCKSRIFEKSNSMQFLFFVNEQKLRLKLRRLKIFQSRHRIGERLKRDFEPVEEKSENEPKIIILEIMSNILWLINYESSHQCTYQ